MTDIVERLCAPVSDDDDYMIGQWPGEPPKKYDALRFEAANEIKRLRAALERIADSTGCVDACECHMRVLNRTRAALEGK